MRFREQAAALRRRDPHREGHQGRLLRAPVRGLGRRPRRRRAHLPGHAGHRLHRRPVADARARPTRTGCIGHGAVDLRHLRRLLLPRPRHRRGRRRRLGRSRRRCSSPSSPTRSRSSTAATSSGPRRSCRTGRSANAKIEFLWNTVGRRTSTATPRSTASSCANVQHRRASRRCPSPACSSPSATGPTPTCSRASSTWRTTATCVTAAGGTSHQRRGRVRLRRRAGPHLPPGDHRRRLRLHGRHRRRALARGQHG